MTDIAHSVDIPWRMVGKVLNVHNVIVHTSFVNKNMSIIVQFCLYTWNILGAVNVVVTLLIVYMVVGFITTFAISAYQH
jgi:hypothetical protein